MFRYEFETSRLHINVLYEKYDSTENDVNKLYGVCLQPIVVPTRPQNPLHPLINASFEAFDSIFQVISVNNNETRCGVIDDNDNRDTLYFVDSEHNFENAFVFNKLMST